MNEPTNETRKSIVDPKYAKMRGASDWVGEVLEAAALTTGIGARAAVDAVLNDAGEEVTPAKAATKGKSEWDLVKIAELAAANNVDTSKYDVSHPSAIGRMRMTVSNLLRSRAKKRGGLFSADGTWLDAPVEFLGEDWAGPVETKSGEKIAKVKPTKEEAEAA